MNKLLLINLFDENLNWSNLWSDIRFIVDKGTAGMVSPYYQYALRPNRGFEAETWAWFFAAYYNELPDYTICLQGDPFDHCDPVALCSAIDNPPPRFHPIANRVGVADARNAEQIRRWQGFLWSSPETPLDTWATCYGGQFSVPKELIRSYPRYWWEMVSQACDTKEDAGALESLWGELFTNRKNYGPQP